MPSPKETKDALARIETAIAGLCEEVGSIRKRLDSLDGGKGPMSTPEIIEFLDGYRVAEATAAAGFGAWMYRWTSVFSFQTIFSRKIFFRRENRSEIRRKLHTINVSKNATIFATAAG